MEAPSLVRWSPLLIILATLVYIFGITQSIIFIVYIVALMKFYKIYIYIFTFILCVLALIYAIWNIYILHKYYIASQKKEKIFIPKTLPDFLITKLETLEMFSKQEAAVKVVKDMYYKQIIFCFIFSIIYIVIILYNL